MRTLLWYAFFQHPMLVSVYSLRSTLTHAHKKYILFSDCHWVTTFHFLFEASLFVRPITRLLHFCIKSCKYSSIAVGNEFFVPTITSDKTSDYSNTNTHEKNAKLRLHFVWQIRLNSKEIEIGLAFFKRERERLYECEKKTHTLALARCVLVQLVTRKTINVQFKWTSNFSMPFHKFELNLLFNPIYSLYSHFLSSATRITFPMEIATK